ncbi:MAG: hypothetical protein ACYTEQ_26970, partial [Planctomycetota bacterium]
MLPAALGSRSNSYVVATPSTARLPAPRGGVGRCTAGACDWANAGEDRATWWAAFAEYVEAMSLYGLIRRGNELWQYVDYGTGSHGGGLR